MKVEVKKDFFDYSEGREIKYSISVLGTVKYSTWYNPWKRSSIEDSLKKSGASIISDYFRLRYTKKISEEQVIKNMNNKNYFHSDLSLDSLYFQITVLKTMPIVKKSLSR